jgi:hypothetical protein
MVVDKTNKTGGKEWRSKYVFSSLCTVLWHHACIQVPINVVFQIVGLYQE